MKLDYRGTFIKIIMFAFYFVLGYLMASWRWQVEIKDLRVQLEKAPKKQTYQISATLERFTRECYMKPGGSFPVITTEPYNEIRLRCFQFWKEDYGSWTELEMNPTFALPVDTIGGE